MPDDGLRFRQVSGYPFSGGWSITATAFDDDPPNPTPDNHRKGRAESASISTDDWMVIDQDAGGVRVSSKPKIMWRMAARWHNLAKIDYEEIA